MPHDSNSERRPVSQVTDRLWRHLAHRKDKPIVRMLKMDRLMKNSPPLWT